MLNRHESSQVKWLANYYNEDGDRIGTDAWAPDYVTILDHVRKCFDAVPVIRDCIICKMEDSRSTMVPKIKVYRSTEKAGELIYVDLDEKDRIVVDEELNNIKIKAVAMLRLQECHLYATVQQGGITVWARAHKFSGKGATKMGIYSGCTPDEALRAAADCLAPSVHARKCF